MTCPYEATVGSDYKHPDGVDVRCAEPAGHYNPETSPHRVVIDGVEYTWLADEE